jgi:hypothetical protein
MDNLQLSIVAVTALSVAAALFMYVLFEVILKNSKDSIQGKAIESIELMHKSTKIRVTIYQTESGDYVATLETLKRYRHGTTTKSNRKQ